MTSKTQALTGAYGLVDIEPDIPLDQLFTGDLVLGLPDPENPGRPRTVHTVLATFGRYRVPSEEPTFIERLLIRVGAESVVAGRRIEGILVDGMAGPGLFALETTPALDRVIF